MFASYDYIGPHRNQYPYEMWSAVATLNDSLPPQFRKELVYPHLPTMLATDPTEGIHSELIIEVMARYFDSHAFQAIGGALAYDLLNFNDAVHQASPEERAQVLETILAADEAFADSSSGRPMFAFFYGTPRKPVLDDVAQLAEWAAEEDEREARAARADGEYYERTPPPGADQRAVRCPDDGRTSPGGSPPGDGGAVEGVHRAPSPPRPPQLRRH